jgi:hypothetical protein
MSSLSHEDPLTITHIHVPAAVNVKAHRYPFLPRIVTGETEAISYYLLQSDFDQ